MCVPGVKVGSRSSEQVRHVKYLIPVIAAQWSGVVPSLPWALTSAPATEEGVYAVRNRLWDAGSR